MSEARDAQPPKPVIPAGVDTETRRDWHPGSIAKPPTEAQASEEAWKWTPEEVESFLNRVASFTKTPTTSQDRNQMFREMQALARENSIKPIEFEKVAKVLPDLMSRLGFTSQDISSKEDWHPLSSTSEEGEKGEEIDQGLERLREHMLPDEVFITNGVDSRAVKMRQAVLIEGQETAQDFAARLSSYIDKDSKWQNIRIIDQAFDINGKPIRNMVAVVGKLKRS